MAVDTRNKRASVLGVALAVTLTLPAPDGTVAQADRQHATLCYAGIAANALIVFDSVSFEDESYAVASFANDAYVAATFDDESYIPD